MKTMNLFSELEKSIKDFDSEREQSNTRIIELNDQADDLKTNIETLKEKISGQEMQFQKDISKVSLAISTSCDLIEPEKIISHGYTISIINYTFLPNKNTVAYYKIFSFENNYLVNHKSSKISIMIVNNRKSSNSDKIRMLVLSVILIIS